jgi:hypothetical protein
VKLDVLLGSYAICRLDPHAAIPPWGTHGRFSSIARTPHELSIVCASDEVPGDVQAQRGYRGLVVRGPLDFGLVGIVAALSAVLASASIGIFVVSTYDTDYLFVRAGDLDRAVAVLRDAGHIVATDAGTATTP